MENTTENNPVPPSPKPVTFLTINTAVAERLALACPSLPLNQVIDRFAEAEIKKRADSLYKAVEHAEKLNRQLSKINRPDVQTFGADRKVLSESWSKARLDEVEKLTKKLAQIDRAVGRATAEKSDYAELFNLNLNDDGGNTAPGAPTS